MNNKKKKNSVPSKNNVKLNSTPKNLDEDIFPVVGVGASAGGLQALKSFFSNTAANSGMAYVVIIHLARSNASILPELLQSISKIPIKHAQHNEKIKPNNVYVIPPRVNITISGNLMQLTESSKEAVSHPIDIFFRSLALEKENNCAAVILSGAGSDGTLGAREIKSANGFILAQSEETASYDSMPRSIIDAGLADDVLPPQKMPERLLKYFSHRITTKKPSVSETLPYNNSDWLNKIFVIIRSRLGRDFSTYKANTINRRIDRRMNLKQIGSHEDYVKFLRENSEEVEALFRELLIGVTSFFRDSKSFDTLKKKGLPKIFNSLPEDSTCRIWVPGCSTGEEVYSLAIIIQEYLDKINKRFTIQIFGTDIDDRAIEKAREGLFPASIETDVSKMRLRRFFTKEGNYYKIRKEIRDSIVFSVQDVLRDPPFSKINLLCFRNVLIYFGSDSQKKMLSLFHYTLKPGGILMLGSSESIGSFSNLFSQVDKKWKIYQRTNSTNQLNRYLQYANSSAIPELEFNQELDNTKAAKDNLAELTQRAILNNFTHPAVLVNGDGIVLYVQGKAGIYLETPSGHPTQNILDLSKEGLKIVLSSALREAKGKAKKIIRENISITINGELQFINLQILPLVESVDSLERYLVVFEKTSAPVKKRRTKSSGEKDPVNTDKKILELEKELQLNRENHQTTVEELESSNEELKSTNEELQSSNEELQSSNEELESSKEELQSLNEELQTVNAELQSKLEELSATQDDMRNLLNSTEIATIFVDNNLRVRRFTKEAIKIVNLIQTDVGRPLEDIKTNLNYNKLIPNLGEVIKNLSIKEAEVKSRDGVWYKMRIFPYRTIDNRIDGGVLTFSNIGEQKQIQKELQQTIKQSEAAQIIIRKAFDLNNEPIIVINENVNIEIANTPFTKTFRLREPAIIGQNLFEIKDGLLNQPKLNNAISKSLEKNRNFTIRKIKFTLGKEDREYKIYGQMINLGARNSQRVLLKFSSAAPK